MKKVYILFFFISFSSVLFAQILEEGFESTTFPPTGWTKQSPDAGTGWEKQTVGTTPIPGFNGGTIASAPVNGGTTVAFCTWKTGGSESNDQWLISPQIIPLTGNILTFWLNKFPCTYADTVKILLSTTGNSISDFTNAIAIINYLAIDTGWVKYTYSLDSYADSSIYIAFNEYVTNNNNYGAAISLDNVYVGAPVGINNVENNTYINIYPNPVQDFLNINSSEDIINVKLYNVIGQIVLNKLVNNNTHQINTSNYTPGMYLLTVETANGTITKKVNISK